mgnify:CR=1 FL=1
MIRQPFHDPGEGWVALDRKIAAALTKIAHGEIGRELTQMTTMSLNNGQFVRGRVLWAHVFCYYASGSSGQVLYDMSHLQSLKMTDNNLEGFHNTWNMVMSELATTPDPATLQFVYYNQFRDFKPMSEDIGHYRRAQWSKSPDYSFEWLWAASCRFIGQKRADYMQGSLNKSMSSSHKAVPGVAPLQGKGEGKPDRKGKNDRSKTPCRPPKGRGRDASKGAPRGRSATKDGGKGKPSNTNVCYAFQKGTCTRGTHADLPTSRNEGGPQPPPRLAPKPEAVHLLRPRHLQVR